MADIQTQIANENHAFTKGYVAGVCKSALVRLMRPSLPLPDSFNETERALVASLISARETLELILDKMEEGQ